uniref:alpha-ketoacid dehydrogenase subunit beta n=1 Tax=Thaumasiovibrio occultus TaxID=1891184 RepID=UPI000B34B342|nr:alpha-ketoacid dehydrogenase subunit beta [Thaumasiovibrio occultus]
MSREQSQPSEHADAVTLLEAVTLALDFEMAHDPNVVVLGEDIGDNGGVFRATLGLKEKYGFQRVMDTPLAEALIGGIAVGMATQGLRPVAEFQFQGFVFPAMEHIVCHAARMRNRTRGRLTCPLVFRAPFGGGIHAPEHHSESVEALFAHTPGLQVVIPSSPQRAYGLLLAAIRSDDPVMFFEPKRIYRTVKSQVQNDGRALPLGRAFMLRDGRDITVVTWGALVVETLQAAAELAEEGVSLAVIDLASIKPLDMDTIFTSLAKTGRLLVVHEAVRSCGVGAEIIARVAEEAMCWLKAPPQRLTGMDTIMPYAKNEDYNLISASDITQRAHQLMENWR